MNRSNMIKLLKSDRQLIHSLCNNINDTIDQECIEVDKLSKNINNIVKIIKKRKKA